MKTRLIVLVMLVAALLAVPGALSAQEAVQPGGTIDGMPLRAGGVAGPPLWAFCSPAFLNPGVTTTDCQVPPLPELAIGHGWFAADEELREASWQAMTWELYLDGQQIDLNAFGTYDDDLPQTGLPGHPPDEEVITKLRSWDVVLGNPTAGPHTLRSVLQVSGQIDDGFHLTEPGTYELVVSFTVAAAEPAAEPAAMPTTGGAIAAGLPSLLLALGALAAGLGAGLQVLLRRGR